MVGRMTACLVHRGPDSTGYWESVEEGIALGHRRLAIQDLTSAGHQPMESRSGRYVLILNGEIYNHLALRLEVQQAGAKVSWRGHSDTETLLALVELLGLKEALKRCVGMFALALWDRERKVLSLARDRVGEKPLYFGSVAGVLYFASELKAIRAVARASLEIDRESLTLYMRHNCVPAPKSIYKGISKLMPGTVAEFISPLAAPAFARYWNARQIAMAGEANPFEGSDDMAIKRADELVKQAVASQMISDVPLGAFLSGGIDSSLIVAMMQAVGSSRAKTFTIGFNEQQYDEGKFAKKVAQHLGTEHTELYVTPREAMDAIPRLPEIYDEPFADSSQIPTYLVSKLAKQQVTVSLSGDAGDELFGGYVRYLWVSRLWKYLSKIPRPLRRKVAKALESRRLGARGSVGGNDLQNPPRFARFRERLGKIATVLDVSEPSEIYYGLVSHWKDPASLILGGSEPLTQVTNRAGWLEGGSIESHMMYLDLVSYLPDDILVKVDRAAMSVALETRVPLLDHRVIEFAWSLPLKFKIRNGEGKWVLRRVLEKYVPPALFERPKTGFGIPIDTWLRGPLRDWSAALLDKSRLSREGYFDASLVDEKWQEHISGKRNRGYLLWDVLMFQAWLESHE